MTINKVIGIGMSKTGTTTLGACLEILGFMPHKGHDPSLSTLYREKRDPEPLLRYAAPYRTLEDAPWYHLYRELDECYPGSKFILTVRKDSLTHARSSWEHGIRAGRRSGQCTDDYLREKTAAYEAHNRAVREYFKFRPHDLLVICWENGDGWDQLCPFLGVVRPATALPHRNTGAQQEPFPLLGKLAPDSDLVKLLRRTRHTLAALPALRRLRDSAR